MISKTKHQFFNGRIKKNYCSVGGSVLKCVVFCKKNNYAALKIIDVGIFLFLFN